MDDILKRAGQIVTLGLKVGKGFKKQTTHPKSNILRNALHLYKSELRSELIVSEIHPTRKVLHNCLPAEQQYCPAFKKGKHQHKNLSFNSEIETYHKSTFMLPCTLYVPIHQKLMLRADCLNKV